jgi:hypothetical protein
MPDDLQAAVRAGSPFPSEAVESRTPTRIGYLLEPSAALREWRSGPSTLVVSGDPRWRVPVLADVLLPELLLRGNEASQKLYAIPSRPDPRTRRRTGEANVKTTRGS